MQNICTETKTPGVLDLKNSIEMIRLDNQNRLMTEAVGGVFPESLDLTHVSRILDLGCGLGGWTMDAAFALETHCVGVDSRTSLIEFAQMRANTTSIDDLATFQVMEITHPLPFVNASFDLVNLRFLAGLLETKQWSSVLQECFRVLKPGGFVLLTEAEWATTSSPTAEQLARYVTEAFWKAGFGFSVDGRDLGVVHALPDLLRQSGACDLHVETHLLDFSYRQPQYYAMVHHLWTTYVALQPFLTTMGYGSQEDLYALYDRLAHELTEETFQGGMILLQAWGHKGEKPEAGQQHFLPPSFPYFEEDEKGMSKQCMQNMTQHKKYLHSLFSSCHLKKSTNP